MLACWTSRGSSTGRWLLERWLTVGVSLLDIMREFHWALAFRKVVNSWCYPAGHNEGVPLAFRKVVNSWC